MTLVLVWLLARSRFALDNPNNRSLHKSPIPRTGGLGLHAGVIAAWFYSGVPWNWVVFLAYAMLIAVSVVDDVRDLPALVRLLAHVIAALVAAALLAREHGVLFIGAVTLIMAWVINLYNFMDGADGLAGGMTVSGFLTYGVAASVDGVTPFAMLNFSIAASALAFLVFNFPPAKIFLGDAGSIPLGFLAAAMGLLGWHSAMWPWWFPAAVFAPFIADATVTLLRRLLAGKPVWQAHREHAYQKLILMGWGHRRVSLSAYGLMLGCGVVALAGMRANAWLQGCALALAVAACITVLVRVERAWRRHSEVAP